MNGAHGLLILFPFAITGFVCVCGKKKKKKKKRVHVLMSMVSQLSAEPLPKHNIRGEESEESLISMDIGSWGK